MPYAARRIDLVLVAPVEPAGREGDRAAALSRPAEQPQAWHAGERLEVIVAAPKPTAPPTSGVPASNLCGGACQCARSNETSLTVSPPACQGGISSSRRRRP